MAVAASSSGERLEAKQLQEIAKGGRELVGDPAGRGAGACFARGKQRLDGGRGPGGGLGRKRVEAPLHDRKRVAISARGSGAFGERGIVRPAAGAPAGKLFDQREHMAQLRYLPTGVDRYARLIIVGLVPHGARN